MSAHLFVLKLTLKCFPFRVVSFNFLFSFFFFANSDSKHGHSVFYRLSNSITFWMKTNHWLLGTCQKLAGGKGGGIRGRVIFFQLSRRGGSEKNRPDLSTYVIQIWRNLGEGHEYFNLLLGDRVIIFPSLHSQFPPPFPPC